MLKDNLSSDRVFEAARTFLTRRDWKIVDVIAEPGGDWLLASAPDSGHHVIWVKGWTIESEEDIPEVNTSVPTRHEFEKKMLSFVFRNKDLPTSDLHIDTWELFATSDIQGVLRFHINCLEAEDKIEEEKDGDENVQ